MKSKKISLLFTICYINSCNKNCVILFGLRIFVCVLISFPLCIFLERKVLQVFRKQWNHTVEISILETTA